MITRDGTVIAGATVIAKSLDSGIALGTAITGADGSYVISTQANQIGAGYSLESSGGTMRGSDFTDRLLAIYPVSADSKAANLTLITTALAEAATAAMSSSGTLLQRALCRLVWNATVSFRRSQGKRMIWQMLELGHSQVGDGDEVG